LEELKKGRENYVWKKEAEMNMLNVVLVRRMED
jgi:hypothetical protein